MIFRATLLSLCVVLAGLAVVAPSANAATAQSIDIDVDATLQQFYSKVPGSRDLVDRAAGVLVFPSVVKAGIGVGGEYGEGSLRVGGRTVAYFNTLSGSIGFQLGVQSRSVIILFMTPDAVSRFRRTKGWKVGVDGSVTVVTIGAGGSLDSNQIKNPVLGFILDAKGLMYNLTLEGTKISKIDR
jgi:lipid-binding SYLF domain-containing protein